ncbi:uncharacterized protein LOC126335688 [Schistocerca gregaria]|uniref:uncharacterized protein LOC126335688 n=1 Tax=Schistocerca gregaria TaxID=7010 RepID=UPI00211DB17C|nr:uncharacterized protein LOC126335688 [Schistocerca gregaria]
MKVGNINVMTLTGKVEELIDFMEKENIELMGLRWMGRGRRKRKGYTLYWSGGQEAKNGVDVEAIETGDLNVQVGKEKLGKEEIIGSYGYGRENEEGEKLFDLYERDRLIVGNTWFRKKNRLKITRYVWGDRQTKTVIDYFLAEKKNRRELTDVTALPGKASDGDHRVVVAKMRFDELKDIKEERESKIKVWKLEHGMVHEKLKELLKCTIPDTEYGNVEEEWGKFKEEFVSSAEKTCGRVTGRVKEKETPW